MLHAEALLLVDDEEAQVLEYDVVGEKAMRADHDVDATPRESHQQLLLFLRRPEATQSPDVDRVVGEALLERVPVLFYEDRGRGEDRDLLAVLDGRVQWRRA